MSTQTVVPEGRGKAKALETFLAGGGGVVSRGGDKNPQFRYQEGKLKGKTREEALSVFESMWSGASPRIKDKYAAMTGADEMLSPSEKEELGTGTNPQPGIAYSGPGRHVSGRGTGMNPVPASAITPPATTTATATPALAVASSTPATTSAQPNGGSPGRGALITNGKVTTPSPTRPPDRMVSDRQPSELGRMAGKVFNGIRGVFGMEQKPEAPVRVPDGKEEGTPVRINRLTGLPFGYQPGDALPTGADGKMERKASESVARQSEASAKATKPAAPVGDMASPARGFTGISREARPAPRADDPDILKKDDAAYKAYQAGFGGASDGEFKELKGAQQKIYDGASSLDKARLVGNTLKRSGGQMQADREREAAANTPKVGSVRNLPNGGRATVVGVRPAEGMGRPYAPPGAGMDQNRRKPIGRR